MYFLVFVQSYSILFAMSHSKSPRVIGIDVGGTNTDAVFLQDEKVLAWHKTPTTTDIQSGVEKAIDEIVRKGKIPLGGVDSVKIGTTVRTSEDTELSFTELQHEWNTEFVAHPGTVSECRTVFMGVHASHCPITPMITRLRYLGHKDSILARRIKVKYPSCVANSVIHWC